MAPVTMGTGGGVRRSSAWAFRILRSGATVLLLLFTALLLTWYYTALHAVVDNLAASSRAALERVVETRLAYIQYADTLTRALQVPVNALPDERVALLSDDLNRLPAGQISMAGSPPWSVPFVVLRQAGSPPFSNDQGRAIARFLVINRLSFGGDENRYGLLLSEDGQRAVLYSGPGLLHQASLVNADFAPVMTDLYTQLRDATQGHTGSVTLPLRIDPFTRQQMAAQALHLRNAAGEGIGYMLSSRKLSSLPLQLQPDQRRHTLVGRLVLAQPPKGQLPMVFSPELAVPEAMSGEARYAIADYVFYVSTGSAVQGWRGVGAFTLGPVLAIWLERVGLATLIYLLSVGLVWWGLHWLQKHILLPSLAQALQIEESEAFNRTILATVPAGIFVCRMPVGQLLLSNAAAQQVLPELANVQWVNSILDPEAVTSRRSELTLPRGNGVCHVALVQQQTRYCGEVVALCAVTDTTAQVHAQAAIESARQAADIANAAKSAFLASMSHEIRTPLFGLLGNLELLGRGRLQPVQQAQLQAAHSSSAALLQIIDDLLDLSRIEAGKLPLLLAPLNLAQLIETTVRGYQAMAQNKGLVLHTRLDPDVPDIVSDAVRLRQILANLLSNAIKFTEHGEICVRLAATRLSAAECLIKLSVTDTGPGVPAAIAGRLFKPYSQADASIAGQYGGSGLGLAICRTLANLLGGDCLLLPTEGPGSTFCLHLSAVTAQRQDPRVVLAAAAQSSHFGLRVLVAEDHPVNRQLLTQQLQALGCVVMAVADGQQALQQLAATPDLQVLLTDVNMPRLGGYALAHTLRQQGNGIPIIGVTASLLQGEREQALASGMSLCLAKPVLLDDLAHALRSLHFTPLACPVLAPAADLQALRVASLHEDLDGVFRAVQTHDLNAAVHHAHRIRGAFVRVPDAEDMVDACRLLEEQVQQATHAARKQADALENYAALWLAQVADTPETAPPK